MPKLQLKLNCSPFSQQRRRAVRPLVEGLEARVLLYTVTGDQWTYDSRITYSFMPDGTNVGGQSSVLFQTLNAVAPTATWEGQIEEAASLWESAANANLALVSDGGEAESSAGNQQDDSRFGDIRIGMVPLASGVLGETFMPPPANGGTAAGDIFFNSTVNWQIGSNYDLMTVAAHEFGHALGLGESSVSTAVMYGTYNGIKQALTTDDINGIDAIYGGPQYDQFNNNGIHNSSLFTATNITSYITSNAQIAIPALDITTSGQAEWFKVTVPSSTTGTMTVTVQSSNLSSLAPSLVVYNSFLSQVGSASAPNTFGATISASTSVSWGQSYYIRVTGAGIEGPIGSYGLLVNFGSQTQSPIPPPNTVVASQPNQGGGSQNDNAPTGGSTEPWAAAVGSTWSTIGNISSWFEQMVSATASAAVAVTVSNTTQATAVVVVGVDPYFTQRETSTTTIVTTSTASSTTTQTTSTASTGGSISVAQAVDEALAQLDSDDD